MLVWNAQKVKCRPKEWFWKSTLLLGGREETVLQGIVDTFPVSCTRTTLQGRNAASSRVE